MSESIIDKHRSRYDPAFDAVLPVEMSVKLHDDMMNYERKQWHRMHDAPPPGIGLDGYPLQKGKRRDAP